MTTNCIRYFLVIVAISFSTTAFSQLSFGIRGGASLQRLTGKGDLGQSLEFDHKPGFHVGANIEFPITRDLFLQQNLLYSFKGGKSEDLTIDISYIEMPLLMIWKPPIASGTLLVGFGPYLGIALSGNFETDGGKEDVRFANSYSFPEFVAGEPVLRKVDVGASVILGYETAGKISINAFYQPPLVKINPRVDGNTMAYQTATKNTGIGLSIGYRL